MSWVFIVHSFPSLGVGRFWVWFLLGFTPLIWHFLAQPASLGLHSGHWNNKYFLHEITNQILYLLPNVICIFAQCKSLLCGNTVVRKQKFKCVPSWNFAWKKPPSNFILGFSKLLRNYCILHPKILHRDTDMWPPRFTNYFFNAEKGCS